MSTKRIFPCALMLAVLGFGVARAQEHLPPPEPMDSTKAPAATPADALPAPGVPANQSNWITYTKPDCCGPVGANGPIQMELFVRAGPSLPVEGAIFGHVLATGWDIDVGGRSLFFNTQMDAAWAIDLGVSNINNPGQHSDFILPFFVTTSTGAPATTATAVTVRDLNRTFFDASFGREWFFWKGGSSCHNAGWRFGIDGGGRYGTAKVEFNQITHRTDPVGGAFVSLHGDLEYPCGCCTFLVGFRTEWAYNWMHILQIQNNSDMEDVNFLITAGVRY
jgi:hypothetical protein